MLPSSFVPRLHRLLGIRAGEGRTVGLFGLHNFLLGIGSILVYVSANLLLLEFEPERNLPLGYLLSAAALLAVGKAYDFFEHRLPLRTLAGRVLLAVVGLTVGVGGLVAFGHSVAAAVAVVTGYRIIYLLSSLEFWGVSAVVFDVRQSKRLFSLISAGDMPAKALGAVLAAVVHETTQLYWLLLVALAAYLGAYAVLQLTLRSHRVEAAAGRRPTRPAAEPAYVQRLFGGSRLVLSLCLSVAAVAAVAAGIEYFFFINVKEKFHHEGDVMQAVGWVLAGTYLAALVVKLLLTGRWLERLGLQRTLTLLPVTVLAALAGFGVLRASGASAGGQLVYFCGLYLVLEVLRRTVFEPAFLVLFQPLAPVLRLKGHTLAKAFYEPLGMALAGALLLALHGVTAVGGWLPYAWMGLLMAAALLLLRRTYGHYLSELQSNLGRRFSGEVVDLRVGGLADDALADDALADDGLADDALADGGLADDGRVGAVADGEAPVAAADAADGTATASPTNPPTHQPTNPLTHQPTNPLTPQPANPPTHQPTTPPAHLCPETLALTDGLAHRARRAAAVAGLARLGAGAVPALTAAVPGALALADSALLRRLAQAAGRVRTPASRALLLHLAQGDNLFARAAALRALTNFVPDPAAAPALHAVVQDELRLAQALLHGQAQALAAHPAHPALALALGYELGRVEARLFDLLLQLYPAQAIADARRNVAQAGHERQANALEMLDNLIPRPIYQGLQALLDPEPLAQRLRLLDGLLGPPAGTQPFAHQVVVRGTAAFTDWTVALALAAWQPTPNSLLALPGHLFSPNPLVRESARAARRALALAQPALHAALPRLHANLAHMALHHDDDPHHAARIGPAERVRVLKSTALFAETPENVLSAIVPIMNEVGYAADHQIFAQGEAGASLFIIYEGEVGVFHGERRLATFGKGDFFGELALLDAEPRSATARTLGPVLAFRLDQEDFYDVMEERPEVLRNILRVLCQRLRRQNEKTTA